MAVPQILSTADLQTADDGLYYVADDAGGYIETEKDGVVHRLMARVRDESDLPKSMQGVVHRADGKQIITEWVLAADLDAPEIPVEPALVPDPVCPLCGSLLTNRVIQTVTICPGCGRSIALLDGKALLATTTQTWPLSPDDIKALKTDRRKARA